MAKIDGRTLNHKALEHLRILAVKRVVEDGEKPSRQHKVRIKVARIFNTYGPRMHPHDGRVVSNFIVQALRGEDITLYGDGSQTRAFCYVDDLAIALLRLMDTDDDVTGPINLGNPHEIPVRELAERIIALTNSRSQLIFRKLPEDDPMQRCPDITRAKQVLDWEPQVELDQGLRRTIAYFDDLLREHSSDPPHTSVRKRVSRPRATPGASDVAM